MLQHVDMKPLKEECDIDHKDELQQITAKRTPMKKCQPLCVTCGQTFAIKNWLTKLIQKEHTELWSDYCGKIFRNRNEVDKHIYEVCESTCHKCSAKYEVERYKEDSVDQKADLIIKMDLEHKEITRVKRKPENLESKV